MCHQGPDSDIELSPLKKHRSFNIFLNDKTSLLMSLELLLQKFCQLLNSSKQLDASSSIEITRLQQPKWAIPIDILSLWGNKWTLFLGKGHILKDMIGFKRLNEYFMQIFDILFSFDFRWNDLIFIFNRLRWWNLTSFHTFLRRLDHCRKLTISFFSEGQFWHF